MNLCLEEANNSTSEPAQDSTPDTAASSKPKSEGGKSLWDQAYDKLDDELVKEYEELLCRELYKKDDTKPNDAKEDTERPVLQNMISKEPGARKKQLATIIDNGEKRMEQKRFRYHICGRDFILDEQISSAAEFLLWGKDFVDEAVKASTEASLAWAGLCLVLCS